MLIRRRDHLFVAHAPTRLDYRTDAGGGGLVDAIAEGKEGIAGHD